MKQSTRNYLRQAETVAAEARRQSIHVAHRVYELACERAEQAFELSMANIEAEAQRMEDDDDGRCPVCGDVLENCPDWRREHGLPSLLHT